MVSASGHDTGCSPLRQPALTHVSRQLRAEALPIYYGERIITHNLKIFSESWIDCVKSVEGMVDAFTGGPNSVPGPGTLQHVSRLQLDLDLQDSRVRIRLILSDSLEPDTSLLDDVGPNLGDLVRVGHLGLDWADATAVQAACEDPFVELVNQLIAKLHAPPATPDCDSPLSHLNILSQFYALRALRVLASACPRLTCSVFVCDMTLGEETKDFDEDE